MTLNNTNQKRSFIHHAWDIIATAFIFFLIFMGGFIFGGVFCIYTWAYRAKNPKLQHYQAQKIVHHLYQFVVYLMTHMGLVQLDVFIHKDIDTKPGRDNDWFKKQALKPHDGILFIANHPTLIDIVVLLSLCPQLSCIVKKELSHHVLLRYVIRAMGYISNEDPMAALDDCVSKLKQGDQLMIFPEGTRSAPYGLNPFHSGTALIALRAQCPLLPILIHANPPFLTKSHKWYQVPYLKPKLSIHVYPQWPKEYGDQKTSLRNQVQALNSRLWQFYQYRLKKLHDSKSS